MMRTNLWIGMGLIGVLLSLGACATLDSGLKLPAHHLSAAVLGKQPKMCTDCHQPRTSVLAFGSFNHDASWLQTHRFRAYQHERICAMCHKTSFCNDCHATSVDLKPSLKNEDKTYLQSPHRGDYLTRHRIDGRIDPTSCIRCHGNPKTSKICAPCHG